MIEGLVENMKLVVFDGNSIINRAFYGIRPLINSKGINTNSVYGFLNILLKFIEEEKPELLCVAFDLKAPTFRKKLYDDYKATRKGMPEELAIQLPILKNLLLSMNITILEQEGYEADDIIGTIAFKCSKEDISCVIATGDRDDLQLATKDTIVKLTTTKQSGTSTDIFDEQAVIDKYGVTPKQLIDVKALMGDASDNIPGVAGVGEKTALSLILEFKSVTNLYNNLDKVKESVRLKLERDKEIAFLSQKLATICLDVPLKDEIKNYILKEPFNENFAKFITDLEFSSILSRLNIDSKSKKDKLDVISKEISIENLIPLIKDEFYFINSISDGALYCFIDNIVYVIKEDILLLKNVFEDKNIKKYSHDVKSLVLFLLQNNIEFNGLAFDTAIAGYILNPSAATYDYKLLSSAYSDYDVVDNLTFMASFKLIVDKMSSLIKEYEMEDLYYNIELKLIKVLSSMEFIGFKVNKEKLINFSDELDVLLKDLTKKIYDIAETEFNINSPKQLGQILFEKLGLPVIKKTKSGYSTNVDVLNKLRDKHEIIEYLLEYRQYSKLKSTYADGLLKVIAEDGRIHSSFNQLITQTGRISSTEPNLQNIPIRSKMGAKIREMFEAKSSDFVLLDADYSQIELRVLASISNDTNMIAAFKNNEDIHTQTAAEVFDIPTYMVTPLMRTRAKA
ncbi:MAG: DNA polymerase, partial [Clostridia bacterium]